MSDILIGILIIIVSIFYLINMVSRRNLEDSKNYYDYWNLAMKFKGWVGGVAFLIIGIILLIKGIKNL